MGISREASVEEAVISMRRRDIELRFIILLKLNFW